MPDKPTLHFIYEEDGKYVKVNDLVTYLLGLANSNPQYSDAITIIAKKFSEVS